MRYEDLYNEWKKDPEKFWINAAQNIDWINFPSFALDSANKPFYKWFPDGLVNTCYNAVDRHVKEEKVKKLQLYMIVLSEALKKKSLIANYLKE